MRSRISPASTASSTTRKSARSAAFRVVRILLLPGEEGAELLAGRLDRVRGTLLAQRLELRRTGVLVGDEALGEGTGLDVGEHRLHVLLHARVDHPRAGDVVAVLGRVGHRPALL